MKTTPGPWRHAELSDEVIGPRGQGVSAPCDGYDEMQWAADARLIAAAPDMLAALEYIVAAAADPRTRNLRDVCMQRASSAVSKAKGGAA